MAINQLLRTSREFEKLQRERDVVSKDQVIAQMMHNWELKKANDQHLAGACQCSVVYHHIHVAGTCHCSVVYHCICKNLKYRQWLPIWVP